MLDLANIADMKIAFPGESAEYRAARDRLLAQEVELRRAMEAVAAARRALPPGGVRRRGLCLPRSGRRRRPGRRAALRALRSRPGHARRLQLDVPAPPRRRPPGPTGRARAAAGRGPVPVVHGAARPARRRRRHVGSARELRRSSPRRRIERVLAFAAGARVAAPAPALVGRNHATTATTSSRPPKASRSLMLNVFQRDGDAMRHFWGSELFYAPPSRARTRATSARSSRCGTCST